MLPSGLTHIDVEPPYYAVIFTSVRTDIDTEYSDTNDRLHAIAKDFPGFIAMHSLRKEFGISISYWRDLESIDQWRQEGLHREAKQRGINEWYQYYRLQIAKIEKHYGSLSPSESDTAQP